MGSSIQPSSDKISVYSETFYPTSENLFVDSFISQPDSFLLGSYYDEKFGTINADILAQLQPPLNFSFADGAKADSAYIYLYYTSWFGDQYSPMEVSIYETNKGTFRYSQQYSSSINVDEYCDKSILLKKRIFSAKDAVIVRDDTTKIMFKLPADFVERFSAVLKKRYTTNAEFLDFFKGLYITTDFGSASMLYINQIDLKLFFHYKYADSSTGDSTTVSTYATFPANDEVRQVNRVLHPDKDIIRAKLASRDSVTYVSSPANVYTRAKLPMKEMWNKMNVGSQTLYINRASVRFYMEDIDVDTVDHKITSNILLIKESAFDRFFKDKELPSDSCAILSSFSYELDETTDEYHYYYNFDLATLISTEFKN